MPGIGAPSESISASPRAAFSVASVGMNACGIRPFTSMIPLSAPTAAPVSRIVGITSTPPMSPQPYASAPVTVHSASSEPTDRSIPPTRITNSWPIARHASGATCTATLERLSPVRKNGEASVMMITSSTRISAGPTRITRSMRFMARSADPAPPVAAADAAVLIGSPPWAAAAHTPVRRLPPNTPGLAGPNASAESTNRPIAGQARRRTCRKENA